MTQQQADSVSGGADVSARDLRRAAVTARRIVVKVGSSSLVTAGRELDDGQFRAIAAQIAEARAEGRQVILVSSGAVAAGRGLLGLTQPPRTIPLKQACAAAGQRALMDRWESVFHPHGARTAQILLTRDDVKSRARFVNARNTFEALLRFGVVPVVNENDTVSVDEIKFGDNDQLSALVTNLVHAELLVLLTDTDGLFTADPNRTADARRIPYVGRVDAQVQALAGAPKSDVGRGGMQSKVKTAQMASAYGVATVVAHGRAPDVLRRALAGDDIGTFFASDEDPLSSRKHWIAYSSEPRGTLVLDGGAVRAVREGNRSLLPSGILAVAGEFGPGDPVRCVDGEGREVARGLTNYGVAVLVRVCGRRSAEIRRILGEDACDEAIHRDDLVVVEG
jgi:glutamate 5-kinase